MKTVILAIVALGLTTVAHTQTRIYVVANATGSGASWTDATGDLAGAMANAAPNTEIWVQEGTYYPTNGSDRAIAFVLRDGVTVIGGFRGTETDATQADASLPTILSGDIGAAGDATDNSYNVVRVGAITAAELRYLRITGGRADGGTESARSGGGVFFSVATDVGATLRLLGCRVESNHARDSGGGLFARAQGLSGNSASATVQLRSCVVSANTSSGNGTGVFAIGTAYVDPGTGTLTVLIDDTEITDNVSTYLASVANSTSGGGVFVQGGERGAVTADIVRSRVATNVADHDTESGGAHSSGNGGGVYATAATNANALTVRIANSVLSGNTAYAGGGCYVLRGDLSLVNTTVYSNRSLGSGGSAGGLYVNGEDAAASPGATGTIVNSIIYANTIANTNGSEVLRQKNSEVSISYTLVDKASCSGTDGDTDIESFDTSDGKLPTLTCGDGMIYNQNPLFTFPSSAGVPELGPGSPAYDAGENAAAMGIGNDYFDRSRIANGTVDLGAIESQAALPVELVDFAAAPRAGAVQLAWRVAAEIDLEGYRVMRSPDGETFDEVAAVPAMGHGDYGFLDRAVLPGQRYYYRLVSRDLDGTTYDSEVVTVALADTDPAGAAVFTRLYPNPTSGEIRVTLVPREGARTVYATVLDLSGRRLRLWPLTTDGEHVLQLGDLPAGQYIVRLTEGERVQAATVVVRGRGA